MRVFHELYGVFIHVFVDASSRTDGKGSFNKGPLMKGMKLKKRSLNFSGSCGCGVYRGGT